MIHAIFTGLVIAVGVTTIWFAGYVVYRLVKQGR